MTAQTNKPIEIVRKEVDDSHYYFVNGEYYPGVTTILDEAAPMPYGLRRWLLTNTQESADETLAITGALGSKLHDAYEQLVRGKELDLVNHYPTIKEKKHIASFYAWFNEVKPTNLDAEHTVASLKYKYAGTLDLACEIDGKLTIIDFKTGAGIYWSHGLQVMAYKQAYEEMTGKKVEQLFILRTGTKHKAGYEFKEIKGDFKSFQNVYQTYLDLHDGKIPEPPLMDVYPEKLSLNLETKTQEELEDMQADIDEAEITGN